MAEPASRPRAAISDTEWLKVLPPASRWAFQGGPKARGVAATAWGVEFSEEACRARARGTRATLWMGPEEYLLLDFEASPAGAVELAPALAGIPHALVDISHRQFSLRIEGPHAATILNGACPLDLELTEFPIGMCTRTVFAKADIVLWRTREETFHLEVWRSFAGYVGGILKEIAAELYPPRQG